MTTKIFTFQFKVTYRVRIFVLNEHIKTIEKSVKKRYNIEKEDLTLKILAFRLKNMKF